MSMFLNCIDDLISSMVAVRAVYNPSHLMNPFPHLSSFFAQRFWGERYQHNVRGKGRETNKQRDYKQDHSNIHSKEVKYL
eukprot:c39002_g1_i1 orf=37-276(+)